MIGNTSEIIIIEFVDNNYLVFEKANQNNAELRMRLTKQSLLQFCFLIQNLKLEPIKEKRTISTLSSEECNTLV